MARAWLLLIVWWATAAAGAQLQQGTISGTVRGPDGAFLDVVTVSLVDTAGNILQSVESSEGRFFFSNVTVGTYGLRADALPFRANVHSLTVAAALPLEIDLRLSPALNEQVVVHKKQTDPGSITTRVTFAGETVRRSPARVRSRALQDAIATTPGWSTEDNGLLHARGVDDGFLYVIDGVPVYERLDGLFGIAPDPSVIDSVNVLTGYVPPEFGFKSGGVIEVRSIGRNTDSWSGNADVGAGSDDAVDFSTVVGAPLRQSSALTIGIAALTSSRFLDPVHPDNFHNDGDSISGGTQFEWHPSSSNTVTALAGFARSDFDVPHGEVQEEAGQNQRQRLRNYWQTVSWQRAWAANSMSQVAGYHRFGSATLAGSAQDTPLFTTADRSLRRVGILASMTHHRGRHLVKFGGEASLLAIEEDFAFAVTDREAGEESGFSDAVLDHTPDRPFQFTAGARPTLFSLYIQDSIRATDHLTLDVGVRADWSRLLNRASQWSPRVGVSYHWPSSGTTLRASLARFFQPPQPENILLASSEAARELSPFAEDGAGGGELSPERQTAIEAAIDQSLGPGIRLNVSYWRRHIRDVADPNVFAGTTIVFANTVARGSASGIDARLELPRRGGWSGYVSYANARVDAFGPITGGLFLEDDIIEIGNGTHFTPDHDQRNVGAFGASYDGSLLSLALIGRYESGTPLEVGEDELDELRQRPGAELVDFDRGRVKPRQVFDVSVLRRIAHSGRVDISVRFGALNVMGARWAYNFGNPFSGTHFGPGRTFQAGLRVDLR